MAWMPLKSADFTGQDGYGTIGEAGGMRFCEKNPEEHLQANNGSEGKRSSGAGSAAPFLSVMIPVSGVLT
jgi:hypothetical protein